MDFPLPEMGEGVYEVEVVGWLVKPGDAVRRGQGLLEVMSDKATMEVPAPFAGKITATVAQVGQKIKVGEVALQYEPKDAPTGGVTTSTNAKPGATAVPLPATVAATQSATPGTGARSLLGPHQAPPAAPAVRRMARKLGIDLGRLHGSGPGGRILIDDLAAVVRAEVSADRAPRAAPKPDYGTPGTRIKFQGMRRKIAEHMVLATSKAPHYTYVDECDVSEVVRVRRALREPFARQDIKLTYLAFFVKAAALALKEVPIVNSSLSEDDGEIVLHDRYHIGIAVATPTGLVVPVIRDADKRHLAEIAHDIERLGNEAKAGKIKLEDLRGGTFTVTSVGNIGGLISTPIINFPEVGILGLGKVVKRPVYDDEGRLYPADIIFLSLSFDHRVVDGAVGAAFGNALIRHVQNPALLLLPEKLLPTA